MYNILWIVVYAFKSEFWLVVGKLVLLMQGCHSILYSLVHYKSIEWIIDYYLSEIKKGDSLIVQVGTMALY